MKIVRKTKTIPSFKREIHSNVISNLNGSRNFAGFFNTLILVILTRLMIVEFQRDETRENKREQGGDGQNDKTGGIL